MAKPELIYGDLKDKYVSKVVLYGHSDNVLYYDSAHKEAVPHDDLLDLAKKGLVLISADETFYHPVFFKDEGSEVKITVATAISSGSSTSKEYQSKTAGE